MTKKYPFFNGFFIFNVLKLINSRVEDPATDVETPDIENPSTGDNVVAYVILGVVALVGIGGAVIYLKKSNN